MILESILYKSLAKKLIIVAVKRLVMCATIHQGAKDDKIYSEY